jgi:hypothetical protein
MIAIMACLLIVPPVQAFWMMMIGQAVLTTIFTQTHHTTMTMTMMMMIGMIGLQVGLMIGEAVRGIAGIVPVGIVKLGL